MHLTILQRARGKRIVVLLSVTFASIVFGLFTSGLLYGRGDLVRALLVLVPFGVIFPLGLLSTCLNTEKNCFAAAKVVRDGQAGQATIEFLDAITGSVRLRLSAGGAEFFQVTDSSIGLVNALRCELKVFENAQQEERMKIGEGFAGRDATIYTSQDNRDAVLLVNDTALQLRRSGSEYVAELQGLLAGRRR